MRCVHAFSCTVQHQEAPQDRFLIRADQVRDRNGAFQEYMPVTGTKVIKIIAMVRVPVFVITTERIQALLTVQDLIKASGRLTRFIIPLCKDQLSDPDVRKDTVDQKFFVLLFPDIPSLIIWVHIHTEMVIPGQDSFYGIRAERQPDISVSLQCGDGFC